ncbi:hypothetical protein TIFTF001_021184 [Ficus carica]|uniref:Protein kinase domain-containing protein n=1 Tax=Ficus carica TaxID=3494 RepID=A0AA88ASA8_FICCA|nr:hypothetical protein TIFTF001_021184 [Ficus carica]
MSSSSDSSTLSPFVKAAIIFTIVVLIWIAMCIKRANATIESLAREARLLMLKLDKFPNDMERENPIRFTSQQLQIATDNFTNLLGSGGFGAVYKGIFTNGTVVAVKVLHGTSDEKIEEQFMAEASTVGRIHHINLVRLYGFCFERNLRALVYEYMVNGSLDKYLFGENKILDFTRLHEIAVGTARGIAYLHEDCQQRIVHCNIKPRNILLDANFSPKVGDFDLAKLCDRENTSISISGGRGTSGYTAPKFWMPFPITHKCDVFSFGLLLFEIVRRRRNVDNSLPNSESLDWFPKTVWKMFECGEMGDLINECGIEEKDREVAERMFKVALLCVQERPQLRPFMGVVVKMLEGALEIPTPSNPFQYLMSGIPRPIIPDQSTQTSSFSGSDSIVRGTPNMTRYEIEIASSA